MRSFSTTMAGLALASLVCSAASAGQVLQPSSDPAFNRFLTRLEAGIGRFINGHPKMFKNHSSRRGDVTIMDAWGGYKIGGRATEARHNWAAARFMESGAALKIEYISAGVNGELAYTVAVERSLVRVADMSEPRLMALRVTQLFRREHGEWKMIHRHADPLIDKRHLAQRFELPAVEIK